MPSLSLNGACAISELESAIMEVGLEGGSASFEIETSPDGACNIIIVDVLTTTSKAKQCHQYKPKSNISVI